MTLFKAAFVSIIFLSVVQDPVFPIEHFSDMQKQIAPLDEPMLEREEGDWLSQNPEPGQSLEVYAGSKPRRPIGQRSKIYLCTLGEFNENEMDLVHTVMEYIGVYYNTEVVQEENLTYKTVPRSARRWNEGQQLWAGYIIYKMLYPNLPEDAAAYICITNYDLYPDKDWNFVFGQADPLNRVAVASFSRYGDLTDDREDFALMLKRIIKTTTHEIGHMFGMEHCVHAKCNMNGSNHLQEADSQPLHLCSQCHSKLAWASKMDMLERSGNLLEYFTRQEVVKEQSHYRSLKELLSAF